MSNNFIKLNLGCGTTKIPGFINIDIRKADNVDVVCDISTLEMFPNNYAELIYASHVLEHFKRNEYKNVLKRWYDVLKDNGTIRIAVPNLEKVFIHYFLHKDLNVLRGFLWGGQNYEGNFHYIGWDFDSLKKDLEDTGFKDVRIYDWKNTEHAHIDDYSQCYLPHMDKENGVLMSLNVEATK